MPFLVYVYEIRKVSCFEFLINFLPTYQYSTCFYKSSRIYAGPRPSGFECTGIGAETRPGGYLLMTGDCFILLMSHSVMVACGVFGRCSLVLLSVFSSAY